MTLESEFTYTSLDSWQTYNYFYGYDKNGNLTSEALSLQIPQYSGTINAYSYSVKYDTFNRMTGTTGNYINSYDYRPDGVRNSKTNNGAKTIHSYDGQNIVMDVDGQNSIKGKYVKGIGVISDISDSSYYLSDGHGNIRQLVNSASGSVIATYDYDAFGVQVGSSGSSTNPLKYSGEYYDGDIYIGSYYLRARNYRPSIGRFTTEDPYWNTHNMIYGDNSSDNNPIPDIKSIMASSNLYVYCMNNPLMYVDSSGLRAVLAVVGEDKASNHNAFLNNVGTFIKDNPNDTVTQIKVWDYNSSNALMDEIISKSNSMGGIDVLLIESHGTSSSLIVSGSYVLGQSANWAGINFNEEANIKFSGCNTGGNNGVVSSASIAQYVANETQRNVWAYVNNTSQKAYDKNGNITDDWQKAVKYYQKPVQMSSGQTVVNNYTQFTPVPKPESTPAPTTSSKVWWNPFTWFN